MYYHDDPRKYQYLLQDAVLCQLLRHNTEPLSISPVIVKAIAFKSALFSINQLLCAISPTFLASVIKQKAVKTSLRRIRPATAQRDNR